jgi:hypothetical protein
MRNFESVGRPRRAKTASTSLVTTRFTRDEHRLIAKAAHGQPLATWLRAYVLRQLKRSGRPKRVSMAIDQLIRRHESLDPTGARIVELDRIGAVLEGLDDKRLEAVRRIVEAFTKSRSNADDANLEEI